MRGIQCFIPKFCILLGISLFSQLHHEAKAETNYYGFQSGFQFKDSSGAVDAYSYGSSLYYDSVNKLVYVTGSTYWSYWDRAEQSESNAGRATYLDKPDCFLGVLKVPRSASDMRLIFADRFGKSDLPESCSALTVMDTSIHRDGRTSEIITAGHTEENGFLTSLRPLGSPRSKMYGFLLNINLDFTVDESGKVTQAQRQSNGGMLINNEITQYPVAITSNPNENEIYLLSLSSSFNNLNEYSRQSSKPDLSAAGGMEEPDYGKNFNVIINKIHSKSSNELEYQESEIDLYAGKTEEGGVEITLKSESSFLFSLNYHDKISSTARMLNNERQVPPFLRVSDLAYITDANKVVENDVLIFAGTTNGYGEAFGFNAEHSAPIQSNHHGFITKLSPIGKILASTPIHQEGYQVTIKGVCHGEHNKVHDLYVVGETTAHLDHSMEKHYLSVNVDGRPSKHAFLTKISFHTFEIIWSRQIGSVNGNDVIGYGCAVSKADEMVYMAGTVLNNDSLNILNKDYNESYDNIRAKSSGGDDVFVANFDSSDGKTKFVRQFGTSEHDSLARGNGIVVDENGNAIILGNTKGSMMRWRGDGALAADGDPYDVFITFMSKDTGDTKIISEISESSGGDYDDDAYGNQEVGRSDVMYFSELVAIVVASTIILATMMYIGYHGFFADRGSHIGSEKMLDYVKDFDDVDVTLHIRHSATGGIHGIYSPKKRGKGIVRESLRSRQAESTNRLKNEIRTQNDHEQYSADDFDFADNRSSQNQRLFQPPPQAFSNLHSTPEFDGELSSHSTNNRGRFGLGKRRQVDSAQFSEVTDDKDWDLDLEYM